MIPAMTPPIRPPVPALDVAGLEVGLGRSFRLTAVSFAVAPGERVAIVGPNGSGKTTLLRALVGLEPARAGKIAAGGRVLTLGGRTIVPPAERGIGLLFQEGVLFPHLDVGANVALGVPPGVPKREQRARVEEALRAIDIGALRGRAVASLSGGEQQRVALARALAQAPGVLLLDEPFHSLDCVTRGTIIREIAELASRRGIATLLVTHEAAEVVAFAERAIVLVGGRKVQEGTLDALAGAPVNPWVAAFLGATEAAGRCRRTC